MSGVRAFRATRYAISEAGNSHGALDGLLSPPYDVISADQRRALLSAQPSNSVLLDLPLREAGEADGAQYQRTANTWSAWRKNGTLVDDETAQIYLYEEQPEVGNSIRGVFAGIPIGPYGGETGILRHESTLSGPKADRRALIAAVQANLSPVILLRAGGFSEFAAAADAASESAPYASGRTPLEVRSNSGALRQARITVQRSFHGRTAQISLLRTVTTDMKRHVTMRRVVACVPRSASLWSPTDTPPRSTPPTVSSLRLIRRYFLRNSPPRPLLCITPPPRASSSSSDSLMVHRQAKIWRLAW